MCQALCYVLGWGYNNKAKRHGLIDKLDHLADEILLSAWDSLEGQLFPSGKGKFSFPSSSVLKYNYLLCKSRRGMPQDKWILQAS